MKHQILSLLLWVVLVAGCASFQAKAPERFAPFSEGPAFRALAPDAVVYRVRTERHRPRADVEFWSTALSRRFRESGWTVVDSSRKTVDGVPAIVFHLEGAWRGSLDQGWIVAVIPHGRRLVLAEAVGEAVSLAARAPEIHDAISTIDLR